MKNKTKEHFYLESFSNINMVLCVKTKQKDRVLKSKTKGNATKQSDVSATNFAMTAILCYHQVEMKHKLVFFRH